MNNNHNNFRHRRRRTENSDEFTHRVHLLHSTTDPFMDKQMQGIMQREEWTDEKHSMYIKSIEASFIDQLYDSKQPATTSGQFKVHRGGFWQKISFERENPQMSSTSRINQCADLTANPWIQHYRSSRVAAPSLTSEVVKFGQKKGISSKSGQLHLSESYVSDQDMICDDTEMSDQNFIDEEEEGENGNSIGNVERHTSLATDAKGNDHQMVPIRKSNSIGDVTNKCVSAV